MIFDWLYPSSLFVALAITATILIYAINHRHERGVRYFIPMLICRLIFSSSVILEMYQSSLQYKLFFRNIEFMVNSFTPPFLILLVLELINKDKLLSQLRYVIFLPSLLFTVLNWGDAKWHVMNQSVSLIDGQLVIIRTSLANAYILFFYLIILLCMIGLIAFMNSIRREIRTPGIFVLFFGSFPVLVEFIRFSRPELHWLLPVTVYCGFTGMIMLIIIYRHKLFTNIPISRNAIVETMQEGIMIVNIHGKVIDCNTPMTLLLKEQGMTSILNQHVSTLLSPWPEWQQLCTQMKEGTIEIHLKNREETKVYTINVSPLISQQKKKLGSLCVLNDITEKQKRLEHIAHLKQQQDKLFTAISHDIRGPVALQMQLIEIIHHERMEEGRESQETIDALMQQIRMTYGMIENLLEWFRSQQEGVILHPQQFNIAELLDECKGQLNLNILVKKVTITHTLDSRLHLFADRDAISLVLRNLLSNAIKFSNSGGKIEVAASLTEDNIVVLTIKDYGIGMHKQQLHDLFQDTSFNSSMGTAGEKGSGIGVLVCRKIMQLSGGNIWAESKYGEGSTFHLSLKGGMST